MQHLLRSKGGGGGSKKVPFLFFFSRGRGPSKKHACFKEGTAWKLSWLDPFGPRLREFACNFDSKYDRLKVPPYNGDVTAASAIKPHLPWPSVFLALRKGRKENRQETKDLPSLPRPNPDLIFLVFLEKGKENRRKSKDVFSPPNPLKFLGKKRKTIKKARNWKKQGNPKKQGKED